MRFYRIKPGSIGRREDEFYVVVSCLCKYFLCSMRTNIITDDIETFFRDIPHIDAHRHHVIINLQRTEAILIYGWLIFS